MPKVLIIEDDIEINQLLEKILKSSGYETVCAYSGTEASLRIEREEYAIILLDLMLPGKSGEDLIKEIRSQSDIPVIVISAKTTLDSKVQVLRMGADDYITKPFACEEVLARMEASLRRSTSVRKTGKAQSEYCYQNLILNEDTRSAEVNGVEVNLTISEFDILLLLLKNPEKVFSKNEIYEKVWHGTYVGEDNTISVHISNIRAKLAKEDTAEYIKTVWGIGFKMA